MLCFLLLVSSSMLDHLLSNHYVLAVIFVCMIIYLNTSYSHLSQHAFFLKLGATHVFSVQLDLIGYKKICFKGKGMSLHQLHCVVEVGKFCDEKQGMMKFQICLWCVMKLHAV